MTATAAVDASGQASLSGVGSLPDEPNDLAERGAAEGLASLTAWIGAQPVATARLARLADIARREFEQVDLRLFPGCSEFTRLALPVELERAELLATWMAEPARRGAVDTSLRVLSHILRLGGRPEDPADDPSPDLPHSRHREAGESM
jgi:hypothetical protein